MDRRGATLGICAHIMMVGFGIFDCVKERSRILPRGYSMNDTLVWLRLAVCDRSFVRSFFATVRTNSCKDKIDINKRVI